MPHCMAIQHGAASGVYTNTAQKISLALVITPLSTTVAGTLEISAQSKT